MHSKSPVASRAVSQNLLPKSCASSKVQPCNAGRTGGLVLQDASASLHYVSQPSVSPQAAATGGLAASRVLLDDGEVCLCIAFKPGGNRVVGRVLQGSSHLALKQRLVCCARLAQQPAGTWDQGCRSAGCAMQDWRAGVLHAPPSRAEPGPSPSPNPHSQLPSPGQCCAVIHNPSGNLQTAVLRPHLDALHLHKRWGGEHKYGTHTCCRGLVQAPMLWRAWVHAWVHSTLATPQPNKPNHRNM